MRPARRVLAEPVEGEVASRVAQIRQSWIVRQLVQLNREGRYEEARKFLDEVLVSFREYCEAVPAARVLVRQLDIAREIIGRPWKERFRKEIELAHYNRVSSIPGYRTSRRPDWVEYLEKDS